jgi:hypothetical protein
MSTSPLSHFMPILPTQPPMKIKVANWNGTNKQRVRTAKLEYIQQAFKDGFLTKSEDNLMLSLPGAEAKLELALVEAGLLEGYQITAVQTARRRSDLDDGITALRNLIALRDSNDLLAGMAIYPWGFEDLLSTYNGGKLSPPSYKNGAWYTEPVARAEMENITNDDGPSGTAPFCIIDADTCGTFNSELLELLSKLTCPPSHIMDSGLLFINCQKGRDKDLAADLVGYSRYAGEEALVKELSRRGHAKAFDETGLWKLDQGQELSLCRNVIFPALLMQEFSKQGFLLQADKLYEYKDANPGSGKGVNMLQWFFSWSKVDWSSTALAHQVGMQIARLQRRWSVARGIDNRLMELKDAYQYINWTAVR